jgi:hypothetical protein
MGSAWGGSKRNSESAANMLGDKNAKPEAGKKIVRNFQLKISQWQ